MAFALGCYSITVTVPGDLAAGFGDTRVQSLDPGYYGGFPMSLDRAILQATCHIFTYCVSGSFGISLSLTVTHSLN